jgi:IclR family pca regulon transcriptional regulator
MLPDVLDAPAEDRSRKMDAGQDDPDFIKSLAKGLAVIEAFDAEHSSMTLSHIARKVGLSPGSTRRVLVTLTRLGYVAYSEKDRRFQLQARTLQLGYSYLAALPALNLLQPRLVDLSDKLNESCSIMMRDGREVVCVARATAKRLLRDYMTVGTRFPLHASPSGKLFLGELTDEEFFDLYQGMEILPDVTPFTVREVTKLRPQVLQAQQQGWIYTRQETALGMASVAVPLRVGGRLRYGLSTSAPLSYDGPDFVERYLPRLRQAAVEMEGLLEASRKG